MPTEVYRAADFQGLMPSVDPTRSNDFFVLNGKNYIFDVLGPKTAFGDRLLLPHKIMKPENAQGIRMRLRDRDRVFTIFSDMIAEWDEDVGGWRVHWVTPDTTTTPYRWTWGYIFGYMYFAHPRVGILMYEVESDTMRVLEESGTPQDVLAITTNNGRLIAMSPTTFSWSRQSAGYDFAPKIAGAGFQVISDHASGYPVMVTDYAAGVLTWTTGGVMRSEFTGDQAVYRHRALNTEYRPCNSFCTIKLDNDTAAILDERGLFQTRGEAPTALTPLFNEFLIEYIQRNNLNVNDALRMEWDPIKRHIYISTSLTYADPIYESAFVLYPPIDKWGQFSEKHYGILPVKIHDSERADDYFGFVDENHQIRLWLDTGSREIKNEDTSSNLYYPVEQKPTHPVDGDIGRVVSSSGVLDTFNAITITQRAGYYPVDGFTPEPAVLQGLNAFVQMGLLRLTQDESNDEMSECYQMVLRSEKSGNPDQLNTNFNLTPEAGAVDYNIIGSGTYGVEPMNYVNHQTLIVATIDGQTIFDSQEPQLEVFTKAARYFSCSISGLWHILQVSAVEVGEAFHLTTFELTSSPAGKLL